RPACASTSKMASSGAEGVLGRLVTARPPLSSSKATRSVKVPPVSMPSRCTSLLVRHRHAYVPVETMLHQVSAIGQAGDCLLGNRVAEGPLPGLTQAEEWPLPERLRLIDCGREGRWE